jgi:hypothetical protein
MPASVHFFRPLIIGLVYLIFAAKVLLHYYRFSIEHNKKLGILRWLVTATSLYFSFGDHQPDHIPIRTRQPMAANHSFALW